MLQRQVRWAVLACACVYPFSTWAASPLTWHPGSGFRFAEVSPPHEGQPGFTRLSPAETGITFSNRLSDATIARNRLYEIGSGVALGDVDGDGWVDIYFCGMEGGNVLYRNLGDWKFEDFTSTAGVGCSNQFSTGCVFADIDGDGDLDLLVNSLGGGTRLFLNDGKGHFTEMNESGLFRKFGATSLALADVDGDGDLDLYVTNYRTDTFFDNPPGLNMSTRQTADGRQVLEPRDRFISLPTREGTPMVVERGEPDVFYLNRGGGKFVAVPWQVGVFVDEEGGALPEPPSDWGLSVMFRDLNGDGLPDLYVCNDFTYWADRIWMNQAGKKFQAIPRTAIRHVSISSMAMDVADINRDGFDDLFVADMLNPRREARAWQRPDTLKGAILGASEHPNTRPEVARNTLQLARGDGTFAEIAPLAGVAATDWTTSALFLDVDLDGWEDLLLVTGNNHDVQDMDALAQVKRGGGWKTVEQREKAFATLPSRMARSQAFRNRHDLTFEDVSTRWGFDAIGVGHGMALADLDNDGDMDVVVNCMNEPARIYRNNSSAARIGVRLKGLGSNSRGIGARIKVSGGAVVQTQEMIAGGRFCSGDDAMRVFAAGAARQLEIEINWRSGKQSIITNARPNCIYEIEESGAGARREAVPDLPQPLFQDVSSELNHTDMAERYDDFGRQPLLPRKLSTLAPGICWADVDGDGYVDLVIAGGKEGHLAMFRNNRRGGWEEWKENPFPKTNLYAQTMPLVWREAQGAQLLAGKSNWEAAITNAELFESFALKPGGTNRSVPDLQTGLNSAGPLALADCDGDGKLDLFIGGRAVAGRYPEAANSYLLRNEGGSFAVMQTLTNLGLVSGAVFTDIDQDGQPDLALACEWGSIRVFHNEHGKFSEVTTPLGFERFKGFWNGIATGDFDGDGRIDLVASNWGRNWRTDEPPGVEEPVQLFYGDFGNDGNVQTLMSSFDRDLSKITPWREKSVVAGAIPSIVLAAPNYHVYGRASVQELLGDKTKRVHELRAASFDSMVFLNRGDHFEPRPLPIEAQFAPGFGVSVADFDGDGNEDIFLAQNFFGSDAEISRQDAGAGLLLLGDGHGGFRALRPMESGISIYGEQRGSAVADFDKDGRMDLAVAQHNGPTRLFRNVGGKAGVRITLRGTLDNPDAIGATVRLKCDGKFGPARDTHAGGGYWSQDSPILVLGIPAEPTELLVRWPDGKQQTWAWPTGAKSVEVDASGIKER